MKTRQKNLNGNLKSGKSSFLFLFLFLFSLTFLSASWINYGGDLGSINNAQLPSNIGYMDNFLNESLAYGQTYSFLSDSSPVSTLINDKPYVVVIDGNYIRLLNYSGLISEQLLDYSVIGQHSLNDFDDDGIKEIVMLKRINDSTIQQAVYEINQTDFDIYLNYSYNYTGDGRNMNVSGIRCSSEGCYSGLTFYNNASSWDLYIMDFYYDSGDINTAVYSLETDKTDYDTFIHPPNFLDIDDDSRFEFLIATERNVYVRDSNSRELNYSYSTGSIKQVSYGNLNAGDTKILIASDSVNNIGCSYYDSLAVEVINQDKSQFWIDCFYHTGVFNDKVFGGMALADYNNDGYEDVFVSYYEDGIFPDASQIRVLDGTDKSIIKSLRIGGTNDCDLGYGDYLNENNYLTVGKINDDDYYDIIQTRDSDMFILDIENNDDCTTAEFLFESEWDMESCLPIDTNGDDLIDVFCSNETESYILYDDNITIPVSDYIPTQITSIPNQNLPFNYDKNLYLNNYFDNYTEIEIDIVNDTLNVELGSLSSDTFSDDCLTLGLIDLSSDMRIAINTKSTNCTRDVEVKAINSEGETTDTFTITINENYEITEFPEEYDNFLTDTAQNVLDLFPDADDLSSGQKIMIIVLVMFIVTAILMFALNTKEGLHTGVLYLTGFVNLMLFIMFIALGYISIGVLIVMALILMAIGYFKLKGDN